MMSLKQFIAAQDENITDSEATKRYAEYQADFRRQQVTEFFNLHKDEEWYDIAGWIVWLCLKNLCFILLSFH